MKNKRIDVTCSDGEIVGCYVGDKLTNPITGVSGTVIGGGASNVQLRLKLTKKIVTIPADKLQYWE